MNSQFASMIVPGARLGQLYAERLLSDVGPDRYARFASPGGVVVRSNHAAFVLGHLSLYPARVLSALDLPLEGAAAPPNYESLFKNGVECQDDPEGRIYPPLEALKAVFFETHKTAISAVESASDEPFNAPNPAEGRMRELFPTVGAAVTFYLIGHVQVHLGQLSAWRRAMDLPPVW